MERNRLSRAEWERYIRQDSDLTEGEKGRRDEIIYCLSSALARCSHGVDYSALVEHIVKKFDGG